MKAIVLAEGGNVFDGIVSFDQSQIPAILAPIQSALKETGIKIIPVGSGATPTSGKKSGDLDVMTDEQVIKDYFMTEDPKTARKALSDFLTKKGLLTKQTGINVHVKIPLQDGAHQVDIMVTPQAEAISKLHIHNIPQNSSFKGVDKHLLINLICKAKNYFWSGWQGLFSRDPEGKKQDFISHDLNVIASKILGPTATSKDLDSVESIINFIKKNNQLQSYKEIFDLFKAERTMTPEKISVLDSLLLDSYIPSFKHFFVEKTDSTTEVGFFPGAFKPFHTGHLLTLRELSKQVTGPVFLLFSGIERKADQATLAFDAEKTIQLLNLYKSVLPTDFSFFKCTISPVKTLYDTIAVLNTGSVETKLDSETNQILNIVPKTPLYNVKVAVGDDPEDRKRYANLFKSQKYIGNRVSIQEVAPARFASATAFRNALENPLASGAAEMIKKCIPLQPNQAEFKQALEILYRNSPLLRSAYQALGL